MNPRKLLVAGALSALSLPAAAGPAIDTCRVTGNVVMDGKVELCRIADEVRLLLDHDQVQQTSETACEVQGELVHRRRECRIELPDGHTKDVAVPQETPAPATGSGT
ncbi:MAG: hypothetical protein KC621_13650 [Myxococcales bacterium]|nr:hypothetical protein [Myxococcales bacterium]